MSKPDLEPKRTLAGITVDPKTLERVIPESRRADGSVRKQLKIRPGFTPQEDVKLFRSTRQQQAERNKLPAGHIPGWAPPSSGSGSRLGSAPGSGAGVGAGVPGAGAGDGAGGTKSKNAAKKAKQKAKKQADKQAALDKVIAENWDDSTDEEPSTTTAAAAATTTKSKSKEQKSASTSEEKPSEVKEESKKESTTTAAAVPSGKDNSKIDGGNNEGDALADELKEKLNV